MKEHIDRAAALQAIDMNISNLRGVAGESVMLNRAVDLVQYTRDFIANVPAADVVEVVRCKDCKHWQLVTRRHNRCVCERLSRWAPPEGYCDQGERRG